MPKGIVFAGDSYTWGEGLQYFSGLETVIFPDFHVFRPEWITPAQMRFIETNRYAKIAAEKLGTFDLVYGKNGGSDLEILNELKSKVPIDYKYSEISAVVVFLTNPLRDNFEFEYEGKLYKSINISQSDRDNDETFLALAKHVNEKFDGEFWKFEVHEYKKHLALMQTIFEKFEKNGVVCRWINWLEDGYNAILDNDYLKERLITITDNGTTYRSIRKWLVNNNDYFIRKHFEHLNKCQYDEHCSPEGHIVIANNIYNNLKEVI